MEQAFSSRKDAANVVLAYLQALNDEDFTTARTYVTDALTFEGVMGSRHGADEYFRDMEKMKLKYKIRKIFSDNDEVCVLYDIAMQGKDIFSCGWYKLAGGKINWFRVVFDPRPLL